MEEVENFWAAQNRFRVCPRILITDSKSLRISMNEKRSKLALNSWKTYESRIFAHGSRISTFAPNVWRSLCVIYAQVLCDRAFTRNCFILSLGPRFNNKFPISSLLQLPWNLEHHEIQELRILSGRIIFTENIKDVKFFF